MRKSLAALLFLALGTATLAAAEEYDAKKLKIDVAAAVKLAIEGKKVKSVDVGGHTFHFHEVVVKMQQGRFVARGILRHSRTGKNAQVTYEINYRDGMTEPEVKLKFAEDKRWQGVAKVVTLGNGGVGDWRSAANLVVRSIGDELDFAYRERYGK